MLRARGELLLEVERRRQVAAGRAGQGERLEQVGEDEKRGHFAHALTRADSTTCRDKRTFLAWPLHCKRVSVSVCALNVRQLSLAST